MRFDVHLPPIAGVLSSRAAQVAREFNLDVTTYPPRRICGDVPDRDDDWSIVLIVGASGSGKTTLLRHVYGVPHNLTWAGGALIDEVGGAGTAEAQAALGAVGLNTVPTWFRSFHTLSLGEQFRADVARRLLAARRDEIVTIDEFTSVLDRQVARVACHGVQRLARRLGVRLVVASCHDDIVDWLQPDRVVLMPEVTMIRRRLQRRPAVAVEVSPCRFPLWERFAPYHYLTSSLHRGARLLAAHVEGEAVAVLALLHRPHPIAKNIMAVSRIVTLPDWQGLGIGPALMDLGGAICRAAGYRLHTYPSHPTFVATLQRSPRWRVIKALGRVSSPTSETSSTGKFGGQRCATFVYSGPGHGNFEHACALLGRRPLDERKSESYQIPDLFAIDRVQFTAAAG